ncbi:MAG: hypothetical protein ACU84Q_21550 [Gammaproteobacteria bacterium]
MTRLNSKLMKGLQLIALVMVFQIIVGTSPQTATLQVEIKTQPTHQLGRNETPRPA